MPYSPPYLLWLSTQLLKCHVPPSLASFVEKLKFSSSSSSSFLTCWFQFGFTSRFFFPRKQLVPKQLLSSTAWWSLLCNRLVFNGGRINFHPQFKDWIQLWIFNYNTFHIMGHCQFEKMLLEHQANVNL